MQFVCVVVLIVGHLSTAFGIRDIVSDNGEEYTYIFTYPQSMISGTFVKCCLTLYNFKLPVNLNVKFVRNRCSSSSQTGCNNFFKITEAHQCVNVEVPMFTGGMVYDELEIDIQGERRRVIKRGRKDVFIFSKREAIFAETDRTIYKPLDDIKIRLLALQFALTPVEIPKTVNVVLQGPNQLKVKQWPNLTIAAGIAQLTYKLQDHAQTGFWKLEVNGLIKATFEVKRYSLPRFKTILEHPQYFFWGDSAIIIKLCSIYTYNEPVLGVGTIEAIIRSSDGKEGLPVTTTAKLIKGCINMQLHLNQLSVERSLYHTIEITGRVMEYGTNTTITKTGSMTINSSPYDTSKNSLKLKPGLPYIGHFYVRDKNLKGVEQNMTICYTHSEFQTPHKSCKNLIIKNEDVVPFTIPPLKKVWNHVTVEASVQSLEDQKFYPRPNMQLKPFYSLSNNSLLIMPLSKDIWKCGDTLSFKVMYTLKNIHENKILFNYKLLSRYDVIKTGVKLINPERISFNPSKFENVILDPDNLQDFNSKFGYFTIDVTLDHGVYTDINLVVFFVTKGEVIADDITVQVEKCLPTKVNVSWSVNEVVPNGLAKLTVSSVRGSFCVITITDIASDFMRPTNRLTAEDILLPFELLNIHYYPSEERNCLIPEDYTGNQHVIWFNGIHKDAYTVFSESKLGVITNLAVLTKPCSYLVVDTEKMYESEVRRLGDEYDDESTEISPHKLVKKDMLKSPIRRFFPQTWLWEGVVLTKSEMSRVITVPGSVTRWVTNVLCINQAGGIGISKPIELTVRKPFFMDIVVPNSVKNRIEPVHISVIVHNRFNHSIPVVITLGINKFMKKFENVPHNVSYCIGSQNLIAHEFSFIANHVGLLNFSISARIVHAAVKNCGNGKHDGVRDIVVKSINVESESNGEHVLNTALVCAGDWGKPDKVGWQLSLPEDQMVLNVEAGVVVDSNILTPLIDNLEQWVRDPVGTADDILSAVTTNVYALRYVKTNKVNNTLIVDAALSNLKIGAQKLYRFFHNDGLFEKNKYSDTLNSVFMTAFVVKIFGYIKQYVPINQPIITRAVAGLLIHQQIDGCFNIISEENDLPTISLTSFVVITLVETKSLFTDEQKRLAKECILKDKNMDTYDMAISTYALLLMGDIHDALSNLEKLLSKAERLDNLIYWKQKRTKLRKKEVDVQISGYVLLSLLHKPTPKYVNYARSIVRWLLTDPQQGQYTTLDIMIILDGISKFADYVNSESSNLTMTISSSANGETKFDVRPGIQHITKVVDIYTVPDYVSVTASGEGCVLVKSSVEFNAYTSYFNVDTYSKILDKCKCTIEFTSCISSNSTEDSLIAVLKVRIPKGYAIDESSLLSLDKQVSGLKKSINDDHVVLLHFSDVTPKSKCAKFVIQETVEVLQRTNITVKIFNYYAADAVMQHSYMLPSCKYRDGTGVKI